MATAIVTGGSRGIGLAVSQRLLADGWQVCAVATRPEPPPALAAAIASQQACYVRGRVDLIADHQRMLAAALSAFGSVDLLVNNAGVAPTSRDDLLVATPTEFDRAINVNLRGPYFLTQLVANQLIAQRGATARASQPAGTIINISSISATTVSLDRGEYCVSKAGVAMATQLWAARLAPEGITVYEVRPGVIATDMTAAAKDRYDSLFSAGLAPIPRWGRPEDVAGAVAALARGDMPYSTGDIIHVAGGMQIPRL
ncbi:MAG: 3-ketoacyl-ACP reductase [Bifidobacteriaceae bacterium]|jgi:NAD(P)-dependent dehydrogenase (short-subunit alcohol dehydrogenase family)|nr:3-ketoacyl-ACP reductase [Bifidobacteriaceae bacterium]